MRAGWRVVVALAACHTRAPAPEPHAFEVRLERTVCFGACPAYSVTIAGDGSVRWHGTSDVATRGDRSGRVTPAELGQLSAAIDRVRFFELQDDGSPPCTEPHGMCDQIICSDTSRSLIRVTRDGKTREIENDHCAPSPADELENVIGEIAHTDAWIGRRDTSHFRLPDN